MNPLPSWRRCPKCGAVEIYTGKPQFDPNTVFVTFRPLRYLAGTGIPSALECPNCGHIVGMQ